MSLCIVILIVILNIFSGASAPIHPEKPLNSFNSAETGAAKFVDSHAESPVYVDPYFANAVPHNDKLDSYSPQFLSLENRLDSVLIRTRVTTVAFSYGGGQKELDGTVNSNLSKSHNQVYSSNYANFYLR